MDDKYKEIINLSAERILNSVSSKHKLYCKSYKALDHVKGKPFVIAIGAFEQPFFYLQSASGILKALYGIESAKYQDGAVFEYKDYIVKKSNNAEIPIGLFTDDRIKEVSAIIFNPIATIGKVRALADIKSKKYFVTTQKYNNYDVVPIIERVPLKEYKESLHDGVQIYINPFAENKIDVSLFNHNDFAIYYNEEECIIKHEFLYARYLESYEVKNRGIKNHNYDKSKKKMQKKSRMANR